MIHASQLRLNWSNKHPQRGRFIACVQVSYRTEKFFAVALPYSIQDLIYRVIRCTIALDQHRATGLARGFCFI